MASVDSVTLESRATLDSVTFFCLSLCVLQPPLLPYWGWESLLSRLLLYKLSALETIALVFAVSELLGRCFLRVFLLFYLHCPALCNLIFVSSTFPQDGVYPSGHECMKVISENFKVPGGVSNFFFFLYLPKFCPCENLSLLVFP